MLNAQRHIDRGHHLESKKNFSEDGQVRGRGGEESLSPPSYSILNPTISPLKSVFNLPQFSVMPKVEDGGRALVPQKVALFTLQNTSPLQAQ